MSTNIIGADLALVHGALVDIHGHIHYAYVNGKGMKVTAEELFQRATILAQHTPRNSIVAVDWDRESTFWGGGRNGKVAVLITMLLSFYGALIQCRNGCEVHYVTPALVRECLGVSHSTGKFAVHEHARDSIPDSLPRDIEGDNVDAFLLALTLQCAAKFIK